MKRSIVTLCVAGLVGVVACSSDPGADPGDGPSSGADAAVHDSGSTHVDAKAPPGTGHDASNGGDDDDDGSIGGGQSDSGDDDDDDDDDSGSTETDSGHGGSVDSGGHDAAVHDAGHDSSVADAGHDAGHDSGVVDSSTGDSGATSLQDICVNEINRYRATNGKPALARWSAEETCADGQSKTDSIANKAHSAFGQCTEFGQCECPGWGGPLNTMIIGCLKAMWAEGPGGGHYDIMNSDSYTKVACGFYTTSTGSIWAAQDYK